jgi:hypothetical protein
MAENITLWSLGMARILFFCFLILVITACGGGDDDSPPVEIAPTATMTVTATVEVTLPPTATPTLTPTTTSTPTPSPTPTITPTLATRVLEVTAVMPGVPGFAPVSGTSDALPLDKWVRLESDHPNLEYVAGQWTEMWSWSAGQNEYHYSVDPDAAVRLAFEGEGLRVCYVAFWNGGMWEVVADGQVVGTVDSYSHEAHFTCTDTFPVAPGAHTLLVRNTGQRNPASSDTMIALDAVLVYRSDPAAVVVPASTLTPSPEPVWCDN